MRGTWAECPTDRVLYVHYRADDGTPFYVGYGSPKRPYETRRNQDWHTVAQKHGIIIQILLIDLHQHYAIIIEKWLIHSLFHKYGKFKDGGLITNRSTGGHGNSGYKWTPDQRQRVMAENNPNYKKSISEDTRFKLSDSLKKFWNSNKHISVKKLAVTGDGNPQFGKFGINSAKFCGFAIGKNTSQFVILVGKKEIQECGFNSGSISSCIVGRKRTHKGFTWSRHLIINPDVFIGLEPYNELSKQRLHAPM